MKETWRHYVSNNGNGGYYNFKTFKVYWSYRWYIAEEMDKIGALSGTDRTSKIRIKTNYADRYSKQK